MKYSFNIATAGIFFVSMSFISSHSQETSESIKIISGAVNGVVIEKNGKNLVIYGDPNNELEKAEMILFTHFRRDVIWAGKNLVKKGSFAIVPAAEKIFFTRGDSIWDKFQTEHFRDSRNQTTKFANEPLKVHRFVSGGDMLEWQDIKFKVFHTPGYTRGSVTYIADIEGKRYAFVGDLIYGDGQLFDLYSLQDKLGRIGGYHGNATRLGDVISSLQIIAEQKPDFLVPVRGPVINNPNSAIQKLIQRAHSVYRNYLSINAYRWYYPELMKTLSDHVLGENAKVDYLPFSDVIENNPPSWYHHFGGAKLIFSEDNSAFCIDFGVPKLFEQLINLKKSGRFKNIDGLFITHYHNDHTDGINLLVKEFKCPVYVTEEIKDITENPEAYHLPCLTKEKISNLNVVKDGHKISWKEFNLTFFYFPGQTLYHDAVLFEKNNGESIFFLGDSFTPAGIDDYCLLNRNFLHQDQGYLYCLDFLRKLPEDILLCNQHFNPLFKFSHAQLDNMSDLLLERNVILRELFPWDNINYGVDEKWAHIYPFGQEAIPGQTVEFSVKILNHSDTPHTYYLHPNLPEGFKIEPADASVLISPRQESVATFKTLIPKRALPGVSLVTVNVKFDKWDLHDWAEAFIHVSPK